MGFKQLRQETIESARKNNCKRRDRDSRKRYGFLEARAGERRKKRRKERCCSEAESRLVTRNEDKTAGGEAECKSSRCRETEKQR